MPKFSLSVNGQVHKVVVDGDTPLLWVLRDELGLTGTKYGCGGGFCRACAVHVDDAPMSSCRLTIESLGERRVTTVEGLSPDRSHVLHFEREGYRAEQVIVESLASSAGPELQPGEISVRLRPVEVRGRKIDVELQSLQVEGGGQK